MMQVDVMVPLINFPKGASRLDVRTTLTSPQPPAQDALPTPWETWEITPAAITPAGITPAAGTHHTTPAVYGSGEILTFDRDAYITVWANSVSE